MSIQEARAAGCRSSAEADRYLEQKRREGDDGANRKENSQAGPSSQESLSVSDSFGTYSTTTSAGQANSWTDLDFVPISGANLLSESVSVQSLSSLQIQILWFVFNYPNSNPLCHFVGRRNNFAATSGYPRNIT